MFTRHYKTEEQSAILCRFNKNKSHSVQCDFLLSLHEFAVPGLEPGIVQKEKTIQPTQLLTALHVFGTDRNNEAQAFR